MKFNTEIAKVLDKHLPANGVGTEREKLRTQLMTDLLMVVNKLPIHSVVSESNFNAAIKHIENSYCDTHLNTPYMLLGDVAELIKILTGKEVDWQELAKHSR